MGETTEIGWCDSTMNFWLGCAKVAPGCLHCYSEEEQVNRWGRVVWGPRGTRSKTAADNWKKPFTWNRKAAKAGVRSKVFSISQGDFFEDWKGRILDHKNFVGWVSSDEGVEWHPPTKTFHSMNGMRPLTMNDLRRDAFKIIDETPTLDWLLLTKRPENVRDMTPSVYGADPNINTDLVKGRRDNVWLGTSVSDQETADDFLSKHLKNAGLGRLLFVSVEPILGPINLMPYLGPGMIEWVIVGGESGEHRRPSEVEWYWQLRNQCLEAGVPCYIKQDTGEKSGEQGRLPGPLWDTKEFPPVLS